MRSTILFGNACLILFMFQSSAKAQYIVMSSSTSYDSNTKKVNGVSQTTMDYETTYFYRCKTKGYIYTTNPGTPLASSEASGNDGQTTVTVNTQVSTSPWVQYNLRSEHYLLPLTVSFGQYYDYYNYYYRSPAWVGGGQYGATQTIFGCQASSGSCFANFVYDWVWMGSTNTSIRTPPLISLTNERITGPLNGSTQNVLLGAAAGIRATVTPSNLTGAYTWVMTGPFVVDASEPNNSYKSVYWTQLGTKTVTVTYAGTGFSVSAFVNVEVKVPTLTSFQGNLGTNWVNRGGNCSLMFSGQFPPYGATYSLECYTGSKKVGMTWTATASIPNVQYMSDPAYAGIEFKQIVSVFRKRMNNGRIECFTTRNPQTDPNTGWNLDGVNPYRTEVPTFVLGNTITAPYPIPPEFDAPAVPLAGRGNVNGTPFEYDAFTVDDRFETYVYYFTGIPADPDFVMPLHIADAACPAERFDCGVDRLVWQWGGSVHFTDSVPVVLYKQIESTTNTGPIAATRTTSPRSYDPTPIQNFGYSLCQGAPNNTNPIDGTRFFVRQHYLDFLGREPDQDGWNHWTSEITRCMFDQTCLRFERNHIGQAFFLVANTVVQDPALANPPGTPGFDAATYNRAYVRHCYLNYLRREPDQSGWDHWTNELNSNGDYWHILDAFQLAPEYRNRFCNGC